MKKYGFGVDIGGTSVKMGFFKADGTLVDQWEIPTRTIDGGKYILEDIAQSMEEYQKEHDIALEDIAGLGMGVPGPVGADGVVHRCVNLGWDVFNVEEAMSQRTHMKVKSGNDANVAALGEMWMGGGQGYQNLVMVTLGTGVGGGVILDGKIVTGANGAAGEIGHIPVKEGEQIPCGCGNYGCLEQYTSATGIARMTREYLSKETTASSLRQIEEITAKDVFDAAKTGDEVALLQVDQFGKTLGKALATISSVLNPQAYVIGGGVAKAGEIVLDAIEKYYDTYAFHAARDAKFELAKLGNDAGIYGAVKMVFDQEKEG